MANKEMTFEERIDMMRENLGTQFEEKAKIILKNGKVLKGEEAEENFNTQLNELTFEIEELYPLNYQQFKEEFPSVIQLIQKVTGNIVVDAVNKGLVLQGWNLESNVEKTIENINNNVKDPERAKDEIALRKAVFNEIKTMKEEHGIDWCADLFWKCWKVKEGESRFNYLVEYEGETLAKKTINNLKKVGGLQFLEVLQKEVYPEEV